MNEKVFISYSRKDTEWADKIKAVLESGGVSCWMDRSGISAGEKYTREIITAIKNCDIFLLVLSPNAEQSEWVPKELGKAIQYHKHIIPAKITEFEIDEFELQLENIQIFDLNTISPEQTLIDLVNTVKNILQLKSADGKDSTALLDNRFVPALPSWQEPKKKKDFKRIGAISAAAIIIIFFLFASIGRSSQSSDDAETANLALLSSTEESADEGQATDTDGKTQSADSSDSETFPQTGNNDDENIASQEAVDELVSYIDQMQEVLLQVGITAQEQASNLTSVEMLKTVADIYKEPLDKLLSLKEQAAAVENIDANLEAAWKEYFTLSYDAQKIAVEIMDFLVDHFNMRQEILSSLPRASENTSKKDYYNALKSWYESAKEAYEAIDSCPAFMEPQWQKYGELLSLHESIINKLNWAQYYDDNLRYQSALNMSERFNTLEAIQTSELMSSLLDENQHSLWQNTVASELFNEIHNYAQMGAEERREYQFENILTGEISLDYDYLDTIYPSLYNSYDMFLAIKTGCISGTRKIVVEAEIPGFSQNYKQTFTLDSAYRKIYIKPPALTGDLDLSSAKAAQIRVTISELDGTLIDEETFSITLKSKYDFEWHSDEYGVSTKDNILCFLTPESSAITYLKRQAIEEISAMTNGQLQSFVGYHNTSLDYHYSSTYIQAAGIMQALYDMGVRYSTDPFSISGSNQHIFFPDDVLELKSGLCVETSLVVASALQNAGMHVFLVFPPDHAQVAVEVWNGSGDDKTGTGQYFLIETTAISNDWEDTFMEGLNSLQNGTAPAKGPITYYSKEQWIDYLSVEGTYLIDCSDSGILGLTPFAN